MPAIPTVIAVNQTGGAIPLDRLGRSVPAGVGVTLTLTDTAYIDEILQDETLYNAISTGNILLDYGSGVLTQGDSLKFFNLVTQEVRISVRAVSTADISPLSGTGQTIDTTVVVAADDRILLQNQSPASENGIWVAKAGAWVRPEDFGTDESAAGTIVYVQEGTAYASTIWNCTTLTGSDVIDTDNLAFAQAAGGGGADSLQISYNGGATIVTAGGVDIAFTLTNGDFTVDDGTIAFGSGTALTAFTVDGATFSIDSTDDSNLSMNANVAAAKTLLIEATNADGGGTAALDIDVDDAITIDSANAGFSVDGVTASNVTVTGASEDLTLSSVGGSVNITASESAIDAIVIDASDTAGGIDIDAGTGGITVDTTGTLVMQSVGASGWTNDSGVLALTTTTTGVIELDGVDGIDLNSTAGPLNIGDDNDDGAINIGTGTTAGRVITIGNNTGTTGVAIETGTGNLLVDAPTTTMTGDLVVQGKTTTVESEIVNIADQFLYLNDGYETTGSPRDGGIVVNVDPQAANDTVAAGGFTAAVPAVSNATVATTGAATFAAGDFIQIKGANDQTNDGLYEVLSHAANVLTVKGVGLTGPVYDFVQNDFDTDGTVQGTIRKVEVGVIRVSSTGVPQFLYGGDSTATFSNLITTATITLQAAYDGGPGIVTDATGNVLISGTQALQITATNGLDVDTIADFDVTTFDVQMTGANGFSISGTALSTIDVDSGDLDLATTTSGSIHLDGIDGVAIESSSGNIDVGADADDGDINIGTGTTNGRAITVGNNTGDTGVVIDSGTEQVEIDGVTYYGNSAGVPTATTSGFQNGDKYFDTNLDMEMRYDDTRGKWLSVEAMFVQFGRDGNTSTGQYYRGIDGRVMGTNVGVNNADIGFYLPNDATVVACGYTRTDNDATTLEFHQDGVSQGTMAWGATTEGSDTTLNIDIAGTNVLQMYNAAAGNATSNVMAWAKVKWRIDTP